MRIARISLLMMVVVLIALPCSAKIYKYKKDGVWYYTDAPPRDKLKESETMAESGRSAPPPSPEGTPLLVDYPGRSAIEKATAATVAVKGGLGFGSGFFITSDGYIITNKHVVRTTDNQAQHEQKVFGRVDGRIEAVEKQFAYEKKRMQAYEAKLRNLKRLADNERDRNRKKSYKDEYAYRLKEYEDWKAGYEKRHSQFMAKQKKYRSQRADYNYTKTVANLSRNFTVILADNTELNARMVATSADHDLALLKLDGYKTPKLKAWGDGALVPGKAVYAIGNPVKLKNSVTSGVFSGYEKGFIQTNAQIYPGNSGGPLVNKDGHVLGINTFKKITHKFEGLGFAIPIQRALDEFSRFLP